MRGRGGSVCTGACLLWLWASVPAAGQAPASGELSQGHPPTSHEAAAPDDTSDHQGPAVVVKGFGDVQWQAESGDNAPNTFRLGQLDGFLNARLSDRVSLLLEIVVEMGTDGEFFIDLERLHIGIRLADWLDLKAGRYHTSVGYYNTAFHHGKYFETAATRPLLFEFEDEGGPLPVHDIGFTAQGRIPSGALGLHYVFETGNGQRWTEEQPLPRPSAVDQNSAKSTNAGFRIAPDGWPGLELGASYYRDRIAGPDQQHVDTHVAAAHAVFVRPTVELLAEAVWMSHAWPQADAVDNHAFYVQASKRWGRVRPYGRYERTRIDPSTPLIGALRSHVGPTIGVRIDPMAQVAIKAQADRISHRYPEPEYRGLVQIAFSF